MRGTGWVLAGGLGVLAGACFDDAGALECDAGQEGCRCFANGTCFDDLECVAQTCVTQGGGSGDGDGSDGPTPADSGSSTTAPTGDTTAGEPATSDDASDDTASSDDTGACAQRVAVGVLEADASISDGSPTNNYGTLPISNIGVGRHLLRFGLPADAALALAEGGAETLELVLPRVLGHDSCGGACPASPGTLRVHPLRNDWVEGTGDGNEPGATWLRRILNEEPWGEPGAAAQNLDRGALAGTVQVDASQQSVTIALDPSVFSPQWVVEGDVSLIVEADARARFVTATKENASLAGPTLEVTWCPR